MVLNSGADAKENRGDYGETSSDMAAPAAPPSATAGMSALPGKTAGYYNEHQGEAGSAGTPSHVAEASLDWMKPAMADSMQAMMVYNAQVALTAKDCPAAADAIVEKAKSKGGYVSGNSQAGKDKNVVINITIKMPSKYLFDFIKDLAAFGDIDSKTVTGEDVGQEYFDLKARKDSLDLSYARLKDLLNKTGKLADLLTVEQEVRRTEEELNQTTGRMKQLENWVSYSTVQIVITPFPIPDVFEKPKFSWLTKTAFGQDWLSFLTFARGIWHVLLFFGAFAPVWGSLLVIVLVIRNVRRKRRV